MTTSPKRRPAALGGALIAVAAAALAIALPALPSRESHAHRSTPDAFRSPGTAPTTSRPPVAPSVAIDLSVVPVDAEIAIDGSRVGSHIVVTRGSSHALRVTARGYVASESRVDADRDRTIVVELVPDPASRVEPHRDVRGAPESTSIAVARTARRESTATHIRRRENQPPTPSATPLPVSNEF